MSTPSSLLEDESGQGLARLQRWTATNEELAIGGQSDEEMQEEKVELRRGAGKKNDVKPTQDRSESPPVEWMGRVIRMRHNM